METKHIEIHVVVCDYSELSEEERELVDVAKKATANAYAPYSQFHVGAAVKLDNGEIVTGTNQENAAYPSGLCAERTAMFYANSHFPHSAPVCMAIASFSDGDFTPFSITPCGACRQVLLEAETRFNCDIRILLYGSDCVYKIGSAKDLLPLAFDKSALK